MSKSCNYNRVINILLFLDLKQFKLINFASIAQTMQCKRISKKKKKFSPVIYLNSIGNKDERGLLLLEKIKKEKGQFLFKLNGFKN